MIRNCNRCGIEFDHRGYAKRCQSCRKTCAKCGVAVDNYGNLCHRCRPMKRRKVKCIRDGCDIMIRHDKKRTGYCQEHVDWSGNAERLAAFNVKTKTKPAHLKYKTDAIHSVPAQCCICNKSFLTTPASVRRGGGKVCSRQCQGVRAAQLTPKSDTDIERIMETALLNKNTEYKKQVPLCGVTLADFFLPESRTAIFCDGDFWHQLPEHKERDKRQTSVLEKNGYRVFRFSGTEIHRSVSGCLRKMEKSE